MLREVQSSTLDCGGVPIESGGVPLLRHRRLCLCCGMLELFYHFDYLHKYWSTFLPMARLPLYGIHNCRRLPHYEDWAVILSRTRF